MKKVIIGFVILVMIVCSLLAFLYCYWQLKAIVSPTEALKVHAEYVNLSSEELIKKMYSIDPFNPYPVMAMDILAQRDDHNAVPILIRYLKSWNTYRRVGALRALRKVGDKRAVDALEKFIEERAGRQDEYEYQLAVKALSRIK